MKCKELKIIITQYSQHANSAVCKLTVKIDDNKYISELELSVTEHYILDRQLKEKLLTFDLVSEIAFIFERARLQMKENRRFGIDTYWKWSTKS